MKTRLFIAIDLNDEIKNYLFNLQKVLGLKAKIKWVAKKNLHLTLKFLGDVEDAEKVIELLNKVKFDSFDLKLKSLEVFDESIPKVLYVDVEPADKVINLQSLIEDSLINLFERDKRFSVHLTVGRIKTYEDKGLLIKSIIEFKIKPLILTVNSFCLFNSVLSKDGPKYTELKEFKLT